MTLFMSVKLYIVMIDNIANHNIINHSSVKLYMVMIDNIMNHNITNHSSSFA